MDDDDFAAEVRSALEAWDAAVEHSTTIEDELWAAAREQRFHPGWERIRLAHERLTILGMQCMTPEQTRINPLTHCPYAQLELLRPKVGAS